MAWFSTQPVEEECALQAVCSESMLKLYNASLNRVMGQNL